MKKIIVYKLETDKKFKEYPHKGHKVLFPGAGGLLVTRTVDVKQTSTSNNKYRNETIFVGSINKFYAVVE